MISTDNHIIGRLPGNHVLVSKKQDQNPPDSEKQRAIDQLKKRDMEVRVHESVHSANPELIKIGAASFDYTIGPDGRAYATGGKVTLTTGTASTPEKALSKAEALKKASLAPGEPSPQDFAAYNAAISMEQEALNQTYSSDRLVNKNNRYLPRGTNFSIYA